MFKRLLWRIRNLKNGYHELNKRAAVEQEMWHCINGKAPMPDKEKLRDWALRLGVPDTFHRKS